MICIEFQWKSDTPTFKYIHLEAQMGETIAKIYNIHSECVQVIKPQI